VTDRPTPNGPDAEPDEEDENGPIRRCIVTGKRYARGEMVRCVVGPDGDIVPDVAAALPGRGLWLTARRDIVEQAIKKHAFDRAAKRPVKVAVDLADRIEMLLAVRCRDAIGLARRSGRAVAGFEKVATAVRNGEAGLLLIATDAADNGRRKMAGLARAVTTVSILTAEELGGAFGRDHIVHAALWTGALAERLRLDGARLAGFRGLAATPATGSERHA
jgi:predicted RNA-binding protein YlxR (DUF448 family)/ribosomal protein L30E